MTSHSHARHAYLPKILTDRQPQRAYCETAGNLFVYSRPNFFAKVSTRRRFSKFSPDDIELAGIGENLEGGAVVV